MQPGDSAVGAPNSIIEARFAQNVRRGALNLTMDKYAFAVTELERRQSQGRLRRLHPPGADLVNFCSNDYLGLARHPLLRRRSALFAERYGNGATASRLVCGGHPGFAAVEERLAQLKRRETALVFNSGFQANVSLLAALADRHSLVLIDRLAHNSLYQGAALSRARVRRYRHNDMAHLEALLQEGSAYSRRLVVSESVFSMDGDRADVGALAALARRHDALLVVDEAHATGVLGPDGMGLCVGEGVDLVIGTCGKGLGSFGAYVACSALLRDYIVNCCAGFIYSTALPPSVLGAIDAALELVPGMKAEREELQDKALLLRQRAAACGWDTGASDSQIVPILVGDGERALGLAAWLEERGVWAAAIRPPTVPAGGARVRLSLSAAHTWEELERLIGLLEDFSRGG